MRLKQYILVLSVTALMLLAGCTSSGGGDQSNQAQLKECLIYDSYSKLWLGVGGWCDTKQECETFYKSTFLYNPEKTTELVCGTTTFINMTSEILQPLRCNTDGDCHNQLMLNVSTQQLNASYSIWINSVKQMVRCKETYCETTEGLAPTLAAYKIGATSKPINYGSTALCKSEAASCANKKVTTTGYNCQPGCIASCTDATGKDALNSVVTPTASNCVATNDPYLANSPKGCIMCARGNSSGI